MKRILYIFIIISIALASCNTDDPENIFPEFEDVERNSIYDYLVENDSLYSKFMQILVAGNIDKTIGAYNPNGNDYTLFLPSNEAIDRFIQNSDQFSSLDELTANKEYAASMARFHVVNMGIRTNDFPFGALPELNLDGQYLTIGFDENADSSFYNINNQAPLNVGNIEMSNGYIHLIQEALTPVNFTTYEWLEQNPNFSIFYQAVKKVGLENDLSKIFRLDTISESPVTLFVESDSVFNRYEIYSIEDLIQEISPDNNDYTDVNNPLYNFVGVHMIEGSYFLADFEEQATNYSSWGSVPTNVNGNGEDILLNPGKVKDEIIVSENGDTTYTYKEITFYYDYSNILTRSGVIHQITEMLIPVNASIATQTFEFFEEPLFSQLNQEGGELIVEDTSLLSVLTFTGGDDQLLMVKSEDETVKAWGKNYIEISGDFSISYTLPKIVEGTYNLQLRAHANSSSNALIEVFLDGVKVGGLIDLTYGGNSGDPYKRFELGTVDLQGYESHTITVQSLIPGTFNWDFIRFEKPEGF